MILHWVWLMPTIMGASFLAILFVGKRMPRKGSEIGIAAVAACFVIALLAAGSWINRVNDAGHVKVQPVAAAAESAPAESATSTEGAAAGGAAAEGEHAVAPVVNERTWFESAGQEFKVGTLVDGLSVMMFVVVTLISLLVHIYSTDYVGGDRRYTHYFAFLSLFTSSMLMLVMSRNIVQFIVSWEIVGLCSFALIGHWWEEKPNSDAALKAFLTNRVGDVGLMIGMITLFWAAGSFDILRIDQLANNGGIEHLLLLVAACCLTAAVMSKSGQFVLHTWLPDAMAGPTPVSALIHAATMVVAGIFMVARLYPVFFHGLSIADGNVNLLATVGGVTVIGGAGLAFVQRDIKKVLAYSTVSQLGYMVMALGLGAWTAGLFHLFTHAFFKAGLFLGSGSVAHAVHSFDMVEDMGGLKKHMPKTYWTFLICTAALIGLPIFAGFWSKDEILAGGHILGAHNAYEIFMVVGVVGALMTAAYMTRCVYLTFHGEPRGAAADSHHPVHESGPRMIGPLYVLAFFAVVAGFANWPFGPDGFKTRFEHYVQPVGDYFPHLGEVSFVWPLAIVSTLVVVFGVLLAYAYWFRGALHGATERSRLARVGHTVLVNKYYFDHLYSGVIAEGTKGPIARASYWINQNVIDGIINAVAAGARGAASFLYGTIDQEVIDGAVNGSGLSAEETGQLLRRLQNGKVQQYGALLFGGAVILAGVLVFTL